MAEDQKETAMDCPPSPPARCPQCDQMFPNDMTMIEHMALEYQRSGWRTHIHCRLCKKYFKSHDALEAHSKRNHPKDQKLDCPACSKHFVRATDMVRHIEKNECPRIDTKKLDAVREQKMWFARELQARHFGDYNAEVEAGYMSRNAALRPKAEATVRPYPVQFEVFESDNVDVYAYYQNVIQASQVAESSTAAQAIEASPQKPQLPSNDTSEPVSIEKWQQDIPKAVGVSLLEDFDPVEVRNLQPSLIDYYDAGGDQRGPSSVFFNPWENDDLIGMSTRASTRASSPIHSRISTPRSRSPVATIVESSSAATIIQGTDNIAPTTTSQAAQPAMKPASVMTGKASQAIMPATSYGGRVTPPYNPSTVMPLRNYKALTPTQASGPAVPPTQNMPAAIPPTTSQTLTPTKAPGTVLSPIQKYSRPEPAIMSQALTPTKGPGAVAPAPAQSMGQPPMADFDSVKKSYTDFAARHNPRNQNFRVQNYWNNMIGKYKCPMPQCFKSFKKPGQFEHHIATHMQEKKCKYPCPGCKDHFDTISALIAHTESQSIRCQFRHSKNYGTFLSQALAGIVDVVGEDMEYGTVQFAISKEAKKNFGAVAPPEETRRSRSDEFKAATAALQQRAVDEDEEQRKFWEEHERQTEAQKAKEREQERAMQAKKEQETKMEEEKAKEEARLQYIKTEVQKVVERQARAESERAKAENKAREEARTRQARIEAQKAKEKEQERLMQVKVEQETKMKEEKAKEEARTRQAKLEHERKVKEQNARGAEQERIRQAKMLQERKAKEESEKRKAAEQEWVQVKEGTSEIMEDDDMKKLEEEERQLVVKMEKIKEQRWKLLQEKEMQAAQKEMQAAQKEMEAAQKEMQAAQKEMEAAQKEKEAAQKEMQANQAAGAGQQRKEEQTYTNWW